MEPNREDSSVSEKLIGLVMIVGCGVYLIYSVTTINGYLSDSEQVDGRVVAVSSGIGAPWATVEYSLADNSQHQTRFKMSGDSGSSRYRVGETVTLYHNHIDGSTRQAFFLSLWFRPILALAGVIFGGVFVMRALTGRS